ncbi:hypothetical protein GCM10027155_07340 [Acinetobacter apis]|uniref:Uncharacterized protein n=1 Tax=Acinetobacter apis TaxID=1229165 RepID=A0A217EEU5_9GAMM|nr:hypothetical protein [Acinetobacter apis]SNQ28812.1 hypothetical protein SAMN05444584_0740 [Acinetobacter apis]
MVNGTKTFKEDWQNGYDCKKCGSEFVLGKLSSGGCLSTIFTFIIMIAALYGGYKFFFSNSFSSQDKQEVSSEPHTLKENDNVASQPLAPLSETASDLNNQEFPKESEQAAHEYTPTDDDYKRLKQEKQQSIATSSDPNQTLNVSTTIRQAN